MAASANPGRAFRNNKYGLPPINKSTGTITGNPTTPLFTVAGGLCVVTALWGIVTTALTTDGGTYALQQNPTLSGATTQTIVTATDLTTVDTAVGDLIGLTRGTSAAPAFLRGGTCDFGALVTTGQIEFVGASSANGAITFYLTYIPLDDGASIVAA
jgi:hypothetical protein